MIPKTKGDCECCDATDTQLYLMHGNILMCQNCMEREPKLEKQVTEAKAILAESKLIDNSIEMVADVWNAATVSFVELEAAVQHDETIPVNEKNFTIVKLTAERIKKLDELIFAEQTALNQKKNERHALHTQVQVKVANLTDEQKKFWSQYDVNYKPVTPKKVKPTTDKIPSKKTKFDLDAIKAASAKYGIPAATIQMALTKGLFKTADEVGQVMTRGINVSK